MEKSTADAQFNFIAEFLKEAGYELIPTIEAGKDIFRKDDIDIIIEIVRNS